MQACFLLISSTGQGSKRIGDGRGGRERIGGWCEPRETGEKFCITLLYLVKDYTEMGARKEEVGIGS